MVEIVLSLKGVYQTGWVVPVLSFDIGTCRLIQKPTTLRTIHYLHDSPFPFADILSSLSSVSVRSVVVSQNASYRMPNKAPSDVVSV